MDKLLYVSYALKCVLGAELMYIACLVYGTFLTGADAQLHHALVDTLPGFTWFSWGSALLAGIYIAAYAFIGGLFIVWMHNSSMARGK